MDYKYKFVKDWTELHQLIAYCKQTGYASTDFETSGTNAMYPGSYPTILGVSFQPGSAWIIPLGHKESPFINEWEIVLKYFGREIIENPEIVKIGQNIKYEMNWWRKYGITMVGRVFDTMLAKYLLDEERPHGLKEMVTRFLPEYSGYDLPGQPSSKAGVDRMIEFWSNIPIDDLSKYCALDADLTFRLWVFFERRLIDNKFYTLFRNMMMMASRVLAEVEWRGMSIDKDYLLDLVDKYKIKIEECSNRLKNNPMILSYGKARLKFIKKKMVRDIRDKMEELEREGGNEVMIKNREEKISRYIAGDYTTKKELEMLEPVNFNSPKQMIDLLFESPDGFEFNIIKYTEDKKTKKKTNTPSTDEEVLLELKGLDDTGFIKNLLELRGLTKLNSTYVQGMWERLNSKNKIHGSFLLHGTVCVSENTPLMTNKGKILIGELVSKKVGVKKISDLGLEIITHRKRFKSITHAVNKGYQDMIEITTERGYKLECLWGHWLDTPMGWKSVENIIKNNTPIYGYQIPELEILPITIKPVTEIIKFLEGYPGYYVSNLGNIFSDKIPGTRGKRGKKLYPMVCGVVKKYRRVGFRLGDGKKYMKKVSNLVFKTFKGPIIDGYQVDHINCDSSIDHINNLQLITNKENFDRAFKYNIKAHSRMLTHNQIFYTDKVQSYRDIGKKLVCDITVKEDGSYIANNFVNHNTGRLSSRNPNLQNIPRDTTASDIKRMFIPPRGKLILQLDYSQAELRVLAAAAKEEIMIQWFASGRDIHLATACHKWEEDYDEILKIYKNESHSEFEKWKIRRKQAKTINFGIVYGQTAKKLAINLSTDDYRVSFEEAQEFLDNFNDQFPAISKHITRQQKFATKNGFVFNLFGRKRRLPNVDSDNWGKKSEAFRQAINAPIQGAASDFTLFSSVLIREHIRRRLLPESLEQVGTVHDSLKYYIDPMDIHETVPKLYSICRNPETKKWFNFEVKGIEMKVDFEIGKNWGELYRYDPQENYEKWVA